MTAIENLLVVAMEEAAELSKAISKVLRFSPNGHHPAKPDETNEFKAIKEYVQLKEMMSMLDSYDVIHSLPREQEHQIRVAKREAVWEHARISEDIGTIKEY